jgi:DNA-binding PadR family transcriptional regulator
MNLDNAHAILVATTEQPHGFLKIADPKLEPEIREMAAAGLITATLQGGKAGSFTAVNSVTDAGRQFLRVFRRHDFSQPITEMPSEKIVVPFVRPMASR